MKTKAFLIMSLALLILLCSASLTSCDSKSVDETVSTVETEKSTEEQATEKQTEESSLESRSDAATTEEATAEKSTEAETEAPLLEYDIYRSDLDVLMQNIFCGTQMLNESVMFLDYGDKKSLMYDADEIISVTSYDGLITYVEGVDYALEDGMIVLLEGSSIPCITSEVYYNNTESDYLTIEHDGEICNVYWGDGRTMTQWQVNVSYVHSDEWDGFRQKSYIEVYEDFLDKLCRGEDVTILFYGDSITRGANSSQLVGHEPYQPDYTKLFTYALADLFDYKVEHIRTGIDKTFAEDLPTYNEDAKRGTITYVNSSVGGWECSAALNNAPTHVVDVANTYGCDLFVLAFGMNNGSTKPKTFQTYMRQTVNAVTDSLPDISVMIVASMVSNPYDTDSGKNHILFEDPLEATAERFDRANIPCALVRMASVSEAILERKTFNDYTTNNINHPNDFFHRVYAQTLLQALIGYENMK